ncbi:methyltransferase domain-containing protein [soil metagenome]
MTDFDALVAEGEAAPVAGWDFSWFEGRATEQRTSWHYAQRAAERLAGVDSSLDIETGGGEVYAFALGRAARVPGEVRATESWPPNLAIARTTLAPFGGTVVELADDAPLPFDDGAFGLVLSRHPTTTQWTEIARVLRPGGLFLAQQIVHGTNRDLYEFMMGPQWVDPVSAEEHARAGAAAAGLEILDWRQESPLLEFFDVAAVIVFLRKVIWTVPDFSVEKYHDRLLAMHELIEREGRFVSRGERGLVEARKTAD